MSALKHEIRQKQAQFNSLETILLRGPRPLPPSSWSPTSTDFPLQAAATTTTKMQRRTSWEALSAYTANGPDSHLPLPVNGRGKQDDIREGVPMDFGVSNASLSSKRAGSPTRSMSRMFCVLHLQGYNSCIGDENRHSRKLCWFVDRFYAVLVVISELSIGHARALAEDGRAAEPLPDTSTTSLEPSAPLTPHREPSSPSGNRKSLGGGNTTKVLADLQAGVMASRTALDNTKAQLRLSQRTVAQVTMPSRRGVVHINTFDPAGS